MPNLPGLSLDILAKNKACPCETSLVPEPDVSL